MTRKRRRQWRPERVEPTPETVAKLKTDVVVRLYRQRVLMRHHLYAAEGIRAVCEGLDCVMFPGRDL